MVGLGVMLSELTRGDGTQRSIESSLGKEIRRVSLRNDVLELSFTDGTTLSLWDDGQSCCENRYMTCDDVFDQYDGATFLGVSVSEVRDIEDASDVHEVMFLHVDTTKGRIVAETHNEHNGYYGGFSIKARTYPKDLS